MAVGLFGFTSCGPVDSDKKAIQNPVEQKSAIDSVEYASAPGQPVDLPDMSKEESVRAEQHDQLLDQWLKEHASHSSKRQAAMEQRLQNLMKDDAGKPSSLVLRYHFDAPFGYLEANAAGALHPARIWRAGRQQLGPKREAGVFGLALRHGSRAAADTSFPADKTFTVSFWIHANQSEARSIFNCESLIDTSIIGGETPTLKLRVGGADLKGPFLPHQWNNITFSHDGKNLTLYINGKEVGRAQTALSENPYGKNLRFSCAGVAQKQFQGLMDELRIYDEALTADKVSAISHIDTALDHLPPEAEGGIHHTLYLKNSGQVEAILDGRIASGSAELHEWSVVDQPEGAQVSISDPAQLKSAVSFDTVGDYTLALRASNSNGVSVDTVKVVVYPPHRREAPARYAQNHQVFTAKSELYSDEFIAKHFPEFPTKLVTQGLARERFKAPPPAYQHPRIFFNHSDLNDMRRRLLDSKAGRSALAKARTWFGMTGSNNITKRDYYSAKKDAKGKLTYGMNSEIAATYCNGAFLAMIDGDTTLARQIITGAVRTADHQLQSLEGIAEEKRRGWQHYGNNLLGRYATSYIYDFLYPWMTASERAKLRKVIAGATAKTTSIGMFSVPGGHGASNWVCWVTGDLLTNICAIEGEDGYDPVVYSEAVKALNNFYTFGIKTDGSPYEGMGKNSITGEELLIMAKRGDLALAYENIYNHMANFHLHVMQPYGYQFCYDDLWGGSNSQARPSDAAVLKYAYPDDPVIDFVYRNVVGDDYQVSELRRTYVYTNGLISCWVAEDWNGDPDWNVHAKQSLATEPTGQLFNDTNVITSRSAWNKDAAYLYFLPRLHGGHNSPARGTFVYSALGRDWSIYPTGHNNKSSLQHSVITVDKKSYQSKGYGRVISYRNDQHSTVAACDLRHTYANKRLMNDNAYRLNPAPQPWSEIPDWQKPNWQYGDRTAQESAPKPVHRPSATSAYRVTSLIKSPQPYALIVDDMQIDELSHHYRWQMVLPKDLKDQVKIKGKRAVITDPTTENFLVLELHHGSPGAVLSYDEKVNVLAIESSGVKARFEIVLSAFKKGQRAPDKLNTLVNFNASLQEMHDIISDHKAKGKAQIQSKLDALNVSLQGFVPSKLGPSVEVSIKNQGVIPRVRGYTEKAYQFDGSMGLQMEGKLPPYGPGNPFTLSMWLYAKGSGQGNLFANGAHRGLSLSFFQGKGIRVSADGNWYWAMLDNSYLDWWTQVVVSYDGETLSLYQNGELKHAALVKSGRIHGASSLEFGKGYKGWIEDFSIYERALSADEVKKAFLYKNKIYYEKAIAGKE